MNAASNPFAELSPPYATIVADPPWHYDAAWNGNGPREQDRRVEFHYSTMTVAQITALPVKALAAKDAHLYLWTTNRYLHDAFHIVEAWGFKHSQVLTWCKPPRGIGPGGAFSSTTEWVIHGRRGSLPATERVDSTWWLWRVAGHSQKPAAFMDVVERVSPGPYLEMFARRQRLGWDSWGYGYESERVP